LRVPVFASLISMLLKATIFFIWSIIILPFAAVRGGRNPPLPPAIPLLTQNFIKDSSKISSLTYVKILSEIFLSITLIYQPTNAHIILYKTLLKHFKTLRHVSILSDHHQGALLLPKVILQHSQFNSYLQTRCCGSISCCVGMCCGAVARCVSYDAHLATAPQHNMICCHNTSFANTNWIVNTVI